MSLLPFWVNTLSTAIIYVLFALAVVFAYRTTRILLFCIGEIGMISAYALHTVWAWLGNDATGFFVSAAVVLLVDALLGVLLYLVLQQEEQEDPFIGTVTTIAFAILFVGTMAVLWGGAVEQLPLPNRTVAFGSAVVSLISLATLAVGGTAVILVLLLFYRTSIGVELQALASNRGLAELSGVPVGRRMLTVWVGASLISGLAGVLSAAISSVSVEGSVVGFSGMVAAIIGGLTSPVGALAGAALLAIGENTISMYFDVRYSVVVPVILLVLLLAVRPSGLSARVEHIART